MSDIALIWDPATRAADFAVEENDLAGDDGLESAVMLSLFTDRQAEVGDLLPDGETDRRGWWADAHPVVEGDRFGSRLWLLGRAKQTQDTLDRAVDYAREALQWLIDDKVASRVDVISEALAGGVLALQVTIYRPTVDPTRFNFNYTWAAQENG